MNYIDQIIILSILYDTPVPLLYQQQLIKYITNDINIKDHISIFHRDRFWEHITEVAVKCKENPDFLEEYWLLLTKLMELKLLKLDQEKSELLTSVAAKEESLFGWKLSYQRGNQKKEYKIIDSINGKKLVVLLELYEVWKRPLELLRESEIAKHFALLYGENALDNFYSTHPASRLVKLKLLANQSNDTLIKQITNFYIANGKPGIQKPPKKEAKYKLVKLNEVSSNNAEKYWQGITEDDNAIAILQKGRKKRKLYIAIAKNLYEAIWKIKHDRAEILDIENRKSDHLTTDQMIELADIELIGAQLADSRLLTADKPTG